MATIFILDSLNLFSPNKLVKIPYNQIIREPWMTKGLLTSSKNLRKDFAKIINKPRTDEVFLNYTRKRNLWNKLKRTAKCTYYSEMVDKYKSDSKSLWKNMNELLGRSKSRANKIKLVIDGTETDDPKFISEKIL